MRAGPLSSPRVVDDLLQSFLPPATRLALKGAGDERQSAYPTLDTDPLTAMAKKKHDDHEEHVNHEAWVIPYADMLTLLMGLFLVLWSMSTTDLAKLEQLRDSLAEGFGMGSTSDAAPPSVIESSEGGLLDGGPGGLGPGISAGARASDPTQLNRAFAALDRESAHAEAVEAAGDELDQIETMIQQSADAAGVSGSIGMRREARGLVVTVHESHGVARQFRAARDGTHDWDAIADAVADVVRRSKGEDQREIAPAQRSGGLSIRPSPTTPGRVRVRLSEMELDAYSAMQLYAVLQQALPKTRRDADAGLLTS